MQTEKFFYDNTSSGPFGAAILELRAQKDGAAIILDKTIFYPEGGGQPGDRGTINGVPLVDVREKDGEILHLVSAAGAAALTCGPVELVLDAARRRDFTMLHTAQHLLSGTILRLAGKPTLSVHLGGELCTIDVDAPELSEKILVEAEEAVADAIEENHPVIIHLCPPEDVQSFPLRKIPPQGEEVIRVVEIEGHDFSPCCGTHAKSTGEIGMLRILGAEKYKGMTRLCFIAGRRCLRDSRSLRHNADIISRALSVPVQDIGRGVLDYIEKTAAAEKQLKLLLDEAAAVKAGALAEKALAAEKSSGGTNKIVTEIYVDLGIDEVLRIGRAAQKLSGAVLLLVSEKDLKCAAFCGDKTVDIRPLLKDAFATSGGRGGGGPGFFQGSFASKEQLAGFLNSVCLSCGHSIDRL
jgi:alanyl-tRNA synthetase